MLARLETRLPDVMLFEARLFRDHRGYFTEVFQVRRYAELGLDAEFVQDNFSTSHTGVLRGLHFQAPNPQGKLIRALSGRIWDVAVDLRQGSPTYGQWESYDLSAENNRSVYIPEGFAHGFLVLEGPAHVLYKCTSLWDSSSELTLRYDDPAIGVAWPGAGPRIVSPKDEEGLHLADMPADRLSLFRYAS